MSEPKFEIANHRLDDVEVIPRELEDPLPDIMDAVDEHIRRGVIQELLDGDFHIYADRVRFTLDGRNVCFETSLAGLVRDASPRYSYGKRDLVVGQDRLDQLRISIASVREALTQLEADERELATAVLAEGG